MEPTLFTIVLLVLILGASAGVSYLIIKAAVAQGIKDALWNLEASMRNAVKNGVLEALAERDKNKTETEKKNG